MPSRSTYLQETYVEGLNEVLRALRALPKEAADELKQASGQIADRTMAPAWRNAALYYAGPWGQVIADSVRVKKDRLPSVNIGYAKRALSGGASSTMVRYPADKGNAGKAGARMPKAFGDGSDWISKVRAYQPEAVQTWAKAVDHIVGKWSVL